MGKWRAAFRILVRISEGKRQLPGSRRREEYNIKMYFQEI
jgi:hypothetical protein